MSIKRKVFHQAVIANQSIGGANASKAARRRHFKEFLDYLVGQGSVISSLNAIHGLMLKGYADWLSMEDKNSTGTIGNKMSSIRRILKAAGVPIEGKDMSKNSDLGISPRSRKGKKEPISDAHFQAVIDKASAAGELGFVHCVNLERYLGLRGQEAMMSTAALLQYAQEARLIIDVWGTEAIRIFDGAKGGRPRNTTVIVKFARETLYAIQGALKFASQNGGFLIQGHGKGLKSAKNKYHRLAKAFGLTGKFAPHSLRYRFACDKLEELREHGVPRAEALAYVSRWLGHGSGRGRWISLVYGRTVVHSLQKTTRAKTQAAVLAKLDALISESWSPSSTIGVR